MIDSVVHTEIMYKIDESESVNRLYTTAKIRWDLCCNIKFDVEDSSIYRFVDMEDLIYQTFVDECES